MHLQNGHITHQQQNKLTILGRFSNNFMAKREKILSQNIGYQNGIKKAK